MNKIRSSDSEYQKLICKASRNELEMERKSAIHELQEKVEFVSTKREAMFLNKSGYEGRRDFAQIVFDSRKIERRVKNRSK